LERFAQVRDTLDKHLHFSYTEKEEKRRANIDGHIQKGALELESPRKVEAYIIKANKLDQWVRDYLARSPFCSREAYDWKIGDLKAADVSEVAFPGTIRAMEAWLRGEREVPSYEDILDCLASQRHIPAGLYFIDVDSLSV
jgi:hypothetical protein